MSINEAITALEKRAFAARTPDYLLCDRAGVSRATLTRWRAGTVKPTVTTLDKLERAMAAIETERAEDL